MTRAFLVRKDAPLASPGGKCSLSKREKVDGRTFQSGSRGVQRKLAISRPDDALECEADRVADEFMADRTVAGTTPNALTLCGARTLARDTTSATATPLKEKTRDDEMKEALERLAATARSLPEVKKLEASGKRFLQTPEGVATAGIAVAQGFAVLYANNWELPLQPPEIPLGFISPSLASFNLKATWEGPIKDPTKIGLRLSTGAGASVTGEYSPGPGMPGKVPEVQAGLTYPVSPSVTLQAGVTSPASALLFPTRFEAGAQVSLPPGWLLNIDATASLEGAGGFGLGAQLTIPLGSTKKPKLRQEKESSETVQRKEHGSESAAAEAPDIVHDALDTPGKRLDQDTCQFMEVRLGHNLGHVRIHDDAIAAASARAINAHAYTVGTDVVFDQGKYRPGTIDGRRLLAHELAHVVQQSGANHSAARVPDRRDESKAGFPAFPAPECEAVRVSEVVNGEATPIARSAECGLADKATGLAHTRSGMLQCTTAERSDAVPEKARHLSPILGGITDRIRWCIDTYRHLNGLSVVEMLAVLTELDDQALLSELIANFDLALGVDRPRLWVAIHAVDLRGLLSVKDFNEQFKTELEGLPADQHATILANLKGHMGRTSTRPGEFATERFKLSNIEAVLVPFSTGNRTAEIKESPADSAANILERIDEDADDWFGNFTEPKFLELSVGKVHVELAKHLQAREEYFLEKYHDPEVARLALGINSIGSDRTEAKSAKLSMHFFGLAIDVNYGANPFLNEAGSKTPRENKVFERASMLVHRRKMGFHPDMSFEQLNALDKMLETYFSYINDAESLKDRLVTDKLPSEFSGKSVADAQAVIKSDLKTVQGWWSRKPEQIEKGGFLDLRKELIDGLAMDWGGKSFGDMMHFDMRNQGIGKKIYDEIRKYRDKKRQLSKDKWQEEEHR